MMARMTWRDELNGKEKSELARAESKRDAARAKYNAVRAKLKSRAEARMRKDRRSND